MRIRHLSIRNFRGIHKLDWALPDTPLFCLIDRGDFHEINDPRGARALDGQTPYETADRQDETGTVTGAAGDQPARRPAAR